MKKNEKKKRKRKKKERRKKRVCARKEVVFLPGRRGRRPAARGRTAAAGAGVRHHRARRHRKTSVPAPPLTSRPGRLQSAPGQTGAPRPGVSCAPSRGRSVEPAPRTCTFRLASQQDRPSAKFSHQPSVFHTLAQKCGSKNVFFFNSYLHAGWLGIARSLEIWKASLVKMVL